jgi:hypothetical protein
VRGRQGLAALAATVMVVGGLIVASGAYGISAPIHISGTGGDGVFIRPTPNTSQPAIGWMPEGASPDYHCYVWGQVIGTVPIWFNVTWNGITGFYTSYYDDSSYSSDAELQSKYGIPLCGAAPPPTTPPSTTTTPPPTTTPTQGDHVFSVKDADGGVYYRESPHSSDTKAQSGVGVYSGDRVNVLCGASGDGVGPYNNTAWAYVENQTRPSIGRGWVSEHYIDDGTAANGWAAGVAGCGADVPGMTGGSAGAPGPGNSPAPETTRSVFFSPNDYGGGLAGLSPGDKNHKQGGWASGDLSICDNGNASTTDLVPGSVRTLAGWSEGRLGPVYYLHASTAERRMQIENIILFDPGSRANMDGSCDELIKPGPGKLLADWVESSASHHLWIFAGRDTEEHKFYLWGHKEFSGLWQYYLPDLWNQPFAGRATICDYDNMGHEDVLSTFAWAVKSPPSSCPTAQGKPSPVTWHP